MNIKFSPPDISEKEVQCVIEALKSGWITTGPKTKQFEKLIADYIGVEKAVCLNSATACLELTLKLLEIEGDDEVITSSYTYTASASVINHVGAKVILVDTAKDSYQMDYEKLANAITSKTKVIIPVDIAGVPCDYEKIFKIVNAKKHLFVPNNPLQKAFGRIIVLADAAHSFGSIYNGKRVGSIADFTCFSFHAVKNLTTAEGGAVVWKNIDGFNSDNIYKEYMLWALHGQNKDALAKTQLGAWEYDIERLGYKCNMTDIMAGIGIAQLERYEDLMKKRKQIIQKYEAGLKNSNVEILPHYTHEYESCGHLLLTRPIGISETQRNYIITKMAEKGIATNVHYKPLPLHTAYKKLGFDISNYPNSYNQYKNEISLPLHTLLTEAEVDYIVTTYKAILNSL